MLCRDRDLSSSPLDTHIQNQAWSYTATTPVLSGMETRTLGLACYQVSARFSEKLCLKRIKYRERQQDIARLPLVSASTWAHMAPTQVNRQYTHEQNASVMASLGLHLESTKTQSSEHYNEDFLAQII